VKVADDAGLRDFLIAASRGGGKNFRDLAGLPGQGGCVIGRGRVYRSGHLGEWSKEARERFAELGVRTVITLQTTQELDILGHPLGSFEAACTWEHIAIGDRWFQAGGALSDGLASMGEFYVKMVLDHPEAFTRFFRLFTREECFAVLYHCTAGRDRTGVATALLLENLGVDRQRIVDDYLVSNASFTSMAQEATVLEPLFREIDAAGGIESFLGNLGLSADELERARRNLLVAQ